MLYLRDINDLTSEQEAAIEKVLSQLGLRVGEVREAILVSLPDPEPEPDPEPADPDPVIKAALEKAAQEDIISFDDVLGRLRRPWWRRCIDRTRRPFRR